MAHILLPRGRDRRFRLQSTSFHGPSHKTSNLSSATSPIKPDWIESSWPPLRPHREIVPATEAAHTHAVHRSPLDRASGAAVDRPPPPRVGAGVGIAPDRT